MKHLRLSLLFLSAALIFAQAPDISTRFDEQVRTYFDAGRFNGAVLVARDGQVLFKKGYGLANAEWDIPVTTTTRFRLGSVTKQFTAMAIMMLEQDGKLKTSDPVCRFIEKCPDAWKPITLHHVLTHSSGIPNFTSFPDYTKTMMMASPPAETLKRFLDRPLDFEPGSKFSYSNSGYVLLGLIVEKASGLKYEDFLKARIFDPLGMKDSGYDHGETVMPRRASGYRKSGQELLNAEYMDMSIPHGAGSLYSTVEDLLKWDQALYTEKLLPKEALARMFTPFKGNYAYGWFVTTKDGETHIGHGGGINGFATHIERVTEPRLVSIALANVLPSEPAKVAADLLTIAAGKTPAKPPVHKEVAVDAKVLAEYVGEYQLGPATLTMTLDNGALFTQLTGQPRLPVFAETETRFFLKVVEATLEFQRDAQGKVNAVVLDQNGMKQRATRKQ